MFSIKECCLCQPLTKSLGMPLFKGVLENEGLAQPLNIPSLTPQTLNYALLL